MSEVITQEDIKKTQNSLSQYIKEPPLSDKLLKKPPFRFLHDIVKSVIKETGFLSDVFTEEDLNLVNIKDKDGKIAFLKKLIAAVKDATGSPISAKPNKIVAGLEVTKTLDLLQAIGKGISLKKSGKLNVQKEQTENKKNSKDKKPSVKDAETVKKVRTKKEDAQEETDKSKKRTKTAGNKENGTSDKKKKERVDKEKPKKKDEPVNIKNESDNVVDEKNLKVPSVATTNENLENVNKEQEIVNNASKTSENVKVNEQIEQSSQEEANKKQETEHGETIVENGLPPSKEEEQKDNTEANNVESNKRDGSFTKPERRPSTRRSSSRTRPSTKTSNEATKKEAGKEKSDEVITKKPQQETKASVALPLLGAGDGPPISVPKIERPTTARKAPPSARAPGVPKAKDRGEVKLPDISDKETEVKPVEVITEDHVQEDDDKENIVVVETQPLSLDNDLQEAKSLTTELENEEVGENEGALVAQILETKRELEESKQLWVNTNKKNVEIEWESGRKQKRDNWEKEVSKLREGIQELTRTTNPLGKLFDFIQEDVDSMQRELKSWTTVAQQYKHQLQQEQKLTETTLEKYKKQLAELDSLIEQEQEAVRNIKANLIANDKKIFNLVTRTNISDTFS